MRPPLVLGQDAAYNAASAEAKVTLENAGGSFINIRPATGQADTLFVFYAGGLVRPQSYEWLGRVLAVGGVQTVIPVFPADLAVTGINRADALIARYGAGKKVVIGGHSLGGAMAAQYAAAHAEKLSGLVLEAAYPPGKVNLRASGLPTLSLLAEHDGVARSEDVRGGLERLPASARLVVVPGAVHSFFGRYGPQKGDGLPTVPRHTAEAAISRDIAIFLHSLP